MPRRHQIRTAKRAGSTTPHWFVFVVVVSISFMLCLAVNFRAFSELREEVNQHIQLNAEIEKLSLENLAFEEEIQNLKSDSRTIEREARKIGMSRPNEKVLVPMN
jgi:cell division protein FtsB